MRTSRKKRALGWKTKFNQKRSPSTGWKTKSSKKDRRLQAGKPNPAKKIAVYRLENQIQQKRLPFTGWKTKSSKKDCRLQAGKPNSAKKDRRLQAGKPNSAKKIAVYRLETHPVGYKKICVNLRSHSIWLGGGMDIRRGLWQRKKNQQLDVSKIAIHEPKK